MHTLRMLSREDKVDVMREGETREEVVVGVKGRRLALTRLPVLVPVGGVMDGGDSFVVEMASEDSRDSREPSTLLDGSSESSSIKQILKRVIPE